MQALLDAIAHATSGPECAAELGVSAPPPDGPDSRAVTDLMVGSVPDPRVVTESGARYRVQVL